MIVTDFRKWVEGYKQNPNCRLRLFCIPYAGGTAGAYQGWQQQLGDAVEVFAIQPPGRWKRITEPPLTRVNDYVSALVDVFSPLTADKPFAIYGHSLGGAVAFEWTRALRQHGLAQPKQLIIGGRRAPHVARREPNIHQLDDAGFVKALRDRYASLPAELDQHPELLELLLPAMRGDVQMSETYQYVEQPPLSVPITAFGGMNDTMVKMEDLEGWRQFTTESFQLQMFNGGHFFLTSEAPLVIEAVKPILGV